MVDWSAPASEASNKRLLYEIALGLLIMTGPALQLAENRAISLVWFGIGILGMLFAHIGSQTSVGHRVDEWFTGIGIGGRIIAIGVAVLTILGAIWTFAPPIVPVASFVVGNTIILTTVPALRLLSRFNSRSQQHPA